MMNITLIEDNEDLREIVKMFFSEICECQFNEFDSGLSFLNHLQKTNQNLELILCDTSMREGNGVYVYQEIRKKYPQLPFLFLNDGNIEELRSLIYQDTHASLLNKPFSGKSFIREATDFLQQVNLTKASTEPLSMIGISLKTLLKIHWIRFPLYLRMNEHKHIKVLNANSAFTQKDFFHFQHKKAENLYVAENDYKDLVAEFKNKVLSASLFDSVDLNNIEGFEYSYSVQELVSTAMKTFGFSEQEKELANKNIKLVKALTEKSGDLKTLLAGIQENGDFGMIHSLSISILTSYLSQHYKFKQEFAGEYLSLAAFFHDSSLNNYQMKNEQKFANAMLLNLPLNKEETNIIIQHPLKSAELMGRWNLCPQPVIEIIEKHHERPDGSGFPKNLKADSISELCAAFIVAEYFAQKYIHKSTIDIDSLRNVQDPVFNTKPYSDFLSLLVKAMA